MASGPAGLIVCPVMPVEANSSRRVAAMPSSACLVARIPATLRAALNAAVQADPGRGRRSARRRGLQRAGDGLGQFLEPGDQVQVVAEPGGVEPGVDGLDLVAQGGDLPGQGGEALAQRGRRGFGGRASGHGVLP